MKNPTTYSPTPFDHFKPVDHSGPSKPLAHNGTRKEIMTPWTHSGKVGVSGTKMGLGDLGSDKANRADHKTATPFSHFDATPHSDPGVPKEPKPWKKKGYSKKSENG